MSAKAEADKVSEKIIELEARIEAASASDEKDSTPSITFEAAEDEVHVAKLQERNALLESQLQDAKAANELLKAANTNLESERNSLDSKLKEAEAKFAEAGPALLKWFGGLLYNAGLAFKELGIDQKDFDNVLAAASDGLTLDVAGKTDMEQSDN